MMEVDRTSAGIHKNAAAKRMPAAGHLPPAACVTIAKFDDNQNTKWNTEGTIP